MLFLLLFAKRGDTGCIEIHLGAHLPIPLIVADIGEVVARFLVVLEPAEHIVDVGLAFSSLSPVKLRGVSSDSIQENRQKSLYFSAGFLCRFTLAWGAAKHGNMRRQAAFLSLCTARLSGLLTA